MKIKLQLEKLDKKANKKIEIEKCLKPKENLPKYTHFKDCKRTRGQNDKKSLNRKIFDKDSFSPRLIIYHCISVCILTFV
jgi:hypothetical protein